MIPECPWCDARDAAKEDVAYLPLNSSFMRIFAPADAHFLADLLWMRSCYYFGQHALTSREYPYLLNFLDLITDLSPQWEEPFLFGAVILPTEAEAVEDGLYLVEKGIALHPDNWELWFFKGYYLWKHYEDKIGAAEAFHQASVLPNAPLYLTKLSATFATRGGDRHLAIRFLQQALKNLKDENQRKILLKKLEEIR
ncbi:hypothetical protein DENIS_1331 [Desulfonema ishimotonii]|uniref:Tetratricopeptide repeat protein n=1 Tax=Desulfonema ishimotonii TaxID=45657 RepID=A0A401FTT4_9BACT|nr:hypothetical protein [Desulfonema ishimotonii]GBC60379.1 hypothetical protein DENIS_1331 [Desulfonema ishimotonii]